MASNSLPHSPTQNTNSNAPFTPATLRRNGGDSRARRPRIPVATENAATGQIAPATALSVSSLTITALMGLGIAAVEAARLALVHEALGGVFADGGGALPFATVLTVGLGALDAGLLLRLLTTGADDTNTAATWAAVGAWLVSAVVNSVLAMYAVAGMMGDGHVLFDIAPVGAAIVLLLLRVLLVGAIAWDRRG